MNNWKRYIPDGARDILFEDCSNRLRVTEELRTIYKKNGYFEAISPTLEYYDVFSGEEQPLPQERMFKLFDNYGRIMVLRPDITTPIGRIAATKLKNQPFPIKLAYNASIFRTNENWNGKFSEILQSGIEIIGAKGSRADAEVIAIGIKALKAAGLEGFKIEIGQAEFFKALIEDTSLPQEEGEILRRLVENKNFAALRDHIALWKNSIGEKTANLLEKLPELFGDVEVIQRALKLTGNPKAIEALESIQEVYDILKKIGLASYLSIDLGMVQYINYYTGIIFRGYSSEVGEFILSGGRYDNLIGQFGLELPATGLAINVDKIIMALRKQNKLKPIENVDYIIFYEDKHIKRGNSLIEDIEEMGYICEQSLLPDEKATIDYAMAKNISNIITINEETTIKLIKTKEDETIEIEKEEFLYILGGKDEENKICTY